MLARLVCTETKTTLVFSESMNVSVRVVPDDGDELSHGELVWNQELGFVQRRQELLFVVALDDHLRTTQFEEERDTSVVQS